MLEHVYSYPANSAVRNGGPLPVTKMFGMPYWDNMDFSSVITLRDVT